MIKLFAFDLDGTLLDKDSRLSGENIEAIKKLNDAGIKTVLTSGRVFASVAYFQSIIGVENPIISTNGSLIGLNSEEIFKSYTLDDDILLELYEFCNKHKLNFHFYDKDTYYSNRVILDRISHLKRDDDYGMNYQVGMVIKNNPVKYLLSAGNHANKFQISIDDCPDYSKEQAKKLIYDNFSKDLYITSSGERMLELMSKGVSKWQAICDVCDLLGINYDEIAAIGDSYNDMPMVSQAKLGFAMGNANKDLKENADLIVSDNNSTGIVEAVNYVLEANKNA
uniref:Cof-type HAD-IIB family hydrolase n=1 Tax=Anaerococcus mediterraneensis TaxID=1870984 RepID=UPI000931083F|nr:Cof-type HAD-IIB family hydrolase [Anaerococcus mediterraneensis]